MLDISKIFQNTSTNLDDEQLQFLVDSMGMSDSLDDTILNYLIGGEVPLFEPGGETEDVVPLEQKRAGLMFSGVTGDYNDPLLDEYINKPALSEMPKPTLATTQVQGTDYSQFRTFTEAFRAAREDLGPKGEFTWNGRKYTTKLSGEVGPKRPASNSGSVSSNEDSRSKQQKDIDELRRSIEQQKLELEPYFKQQREINKQKKIIEQQKRELGFSSKQQRDIEELRKSIEQQKRELKSFAPGGMFQGDPTASPLRPVENIRFSELESYEGKIPVFGPKGIVYMTPEEATASGAKALTSDIRYKDPDSSSFTIAQQGSFVDPEYMKLLYSQDNMRFNETLDQKELDDNIRKQDERMKLFNLLSNDTDFSVEDALYKTGESLAYTPNIEDFTNSETGEVNETGMGLAKGLNVARGLAASGKAILGGARNVMAGYAQQQRKDLLMQDYYKKQRRALDNQNLRYGEKGGEMPFYNDGGYLQFLEEGDQRQYSQMGPQEPREQQPLTQEMTGEYIQQQPVQAGITPNAEVEEDEYVQHPDGQVQQVEGREHAEGGERLALEPGTKIISDKLKLGAKNAKTLSKEYGITVKASDTFAQALEKFTKKIGITELNTQQEEYFNKLKKDSKTRSEQTSELNSEFLSEKINGIEQKKSVLEAIRSNFTNVIYDLQEKSKGNTQETTENLPIEKKNIDEAIEYAYGGEIPSFEVGGEVLKKIMESMGYNIETNEDHKKLYDEILVDDRLAKINGPKLYERLAQSSPDKDKGLPKTYKEFVGSPFQKQNFPELDFFETLSSNYTPPAEPVREDRGLNTSRTKESVPTKIGRTGVEGTNFRSLRTNPVTQDVVDAQAPTDSGSTVQTSGKISKENLGTVNEFLYNNFPQARKFFTAETKRDGRVGNVQVNDVEGLQTYYDKTLYPALIKWGQDNIEDVNERNKYLDAIDQFRFDDKDKGTRQIDGILGNYTASKNPIAWKFVTPEEKKQLANKGITYTSQLFDDNGELVEAASFLSEDSKQRLLKTKDYGGLDLQIDEIEAPVDNEQTPYDPINPTRPQTYQRPILPDMSLEPPAGMESHLKTQRRYELVDPIAISPDQQLTELYRQENSVVGQLDGLTDTQRAAALTNLGANTQQNASKIMSGTTMANAEMQSKADMLNAEIMNREVDARAVDDLDYERRQLTAKALSDQDRNDYLEKSREMRIKRFNYLTKHRQMNDLAENFNTAADGSIVFDKGTSNILFNNYIKSGLTPDQALLQVKKDEERIKKDSLGNVTGSTITKSTITKTK